MNIKNNYLLENKEVIEEIKRHLWIESEKAGRDLGFEWAAQDWLERFSDAWIQYHSPKKKVSASGGNGKPITSQATSTVKKRRAKSYTSA